MRRVLLLGVAVVVVATGLWVLVIGAPALPMAGIHLDRVRLPEGFRIGLYTDEVPGARSMAMAPGGTLFVGTRDAGRVYAVRDEDGDGRAERVVVFAQGLDTPNGVAVRDGALYVAEVARVLRYDRAEASLDAPPRPQVVHAGLPSDRRHGWKFVRFGPDGRLYVPVGAPGNAVLRDDDPRYAAILRETADRRGLEVFASGVRNTVGFDWQPGTDVLWFTDNGRDGMGDDVPPDELNRAPKAGLHFGYPHVHGASTVDPEFGGRRPRADLVPPARELGAHVAALGMRFYTGTMFPEAWRGHAFVAEHGSWNRSSPVGYRVTVVRVRGDRAESYEPFAEGWLSGRSAWGRPVDVEVARDGALLVSDDRAGAVYRITYAAPAK